MSEADDKMVLDSVVRTVDGQKLPIRLIKSAVVRVALSELQLERDKERLEELLKLRRATAALSAETARTTPRDRGQQVKFRKKPVVIDAHRWFKNGDHPDDYARDREGFENGELVTFPAARCRELGWEGAVVRYFRRPDVAGETLCQHCGATMHVHGWIDTLEGGHNVCPGDWIITGVKGELYPCKPDIFEATYEAAE